MNCPDYNAPHALKAFLETHGLAMQKKFGQNFMVNPGIRTKLIDLLCVQDADSIWEIGPGLGCMTAELLQRNAKVTAFEIDRGFIDALKDIFSQELQEEKLRIIPGNVLKTWTEERKLRLPQKLFGNLPYNIAASFIADTIRDGFLFDRCVFTVQKEVAQRMNARAGSPHYSAFSVLCQWRYDIKLSVELAPGTFWPSPSVYSQAVVFTKKDTFSPCSDPKLFVRLVHTLFSQRRKTLSNNIKVLIPSAAAAFDLFDRAGISPQERAEKLTLDDFIRLCELLRSDILNEGGTGA